MLTFSNEQLREQVGRDLGETAGQVIQQTDFLSFTDLAASGAASVRADGGTIKQSPLIPQIIPMHGLIYDVDSGALQMVAE